MNVAAELRRELTADLGPGRVLHLWVRALAAGADAAVWLEAEGSLRPLCRTEAAGFAFAEARAAGPAVLSWDGRTTEVSCIYAYDPATVIETGIEPLHLSNAARPPALPNGVHFRPPFGWMNDPNAFCRLGETYHLFYQHSPHAAVWSPMHWGHAVSRDLVIWVHQPVFLRPELEAATEADIHGGAYSGSAIPLPDGTGLRIYYTDSLKGRLPAPELQRSTLYRDGAGAAESEVVIAIPPSDLALTGDFRDPYVFKGPDGRLHMLLGSSDADGGVVLLYRTDDPDGTRGWTFTSVLWRDGCMGTTVAECPCLVPLDGSPAAATLWALIYAQLGSLDPATGRRNLSAAIVGRFDGERFEPSFERELDFGTSAYAYQAFATEEGPIGIAWMANWADWDRASDFPTAMTLPTQLKLSRESDALLVAPHPAILALRRDFLDEAALARGEWVQLPNGTAEVEVVLARLAAPVRIEARGGGRVVAVELGPEGLEMLPTTGGARLIASGAAPTRLRVVLDTGSIEVFADDGRWTGTCRGSPDIRFDAVRVVVDPLDLVETRAWTLALPRATQQEETS